MERYQLRWFSRVSKMRQERSARQVLLATPAGKWPRRRPRTRWNDYISNVALPRLGVKPAKLFGFAVDNEVFRYLGLLGGKAGAKMKELACSLAQTAIVSKDIRKKNKLKHNVFQFSCETVCQVYSAKSRSLQAPNPHKRKKHKSKCKVCVLSQMLTRTSGFHHELKDDIAAPLSGQY